MKRLLGICAFLLAIGVQPATAREFGLDIGSSFLYAGGTTADVLGSERQMNHFLLRTSVELKPNLQAELQWQTGSQSASLFAGAATQDVTTHWLSAGVRWLRPVADWLRPFARVGAGATREKLSVISQDATFAQAFWTPHAFGFVGVDLLLPREVLSGGRGTGGPTFGLTWELGYEHAVGRGAVLLSNREVTPDMPRASLDMGTFTLGGWVQQLAVTLRL